MTDKYDDLFREAAERNGLDWLLLKAQAIEESGLDPEAVSPAGAKGIAQFMRNTWAEWGHGSVRDPEAAIDAQARYMAWLIKHFKHDGIPLALAAYNFGIGHVEREMPWPQETHHYVARVQARWAALQAEATVAANPSVFGEESDDAAE